MANYNRGTSAQIIVGAAALFTYENGTLTDAYMKTNVAASNALSYKETLQVGANAANSYTGTMGFRNVGYTSNGLELQFQPDFGEVKVDQILDVAKLYKQGMQVNMKTSFAESTLENLLFAIAGKGGSDGDLQSGANVANTSPFYGNTASTTVKELNLSSGNIGECPVERGLVAVGPGTGDCAVGSSTERIYVAYRALSIESVTVSAKRDEATMFEVSFRLLPNDSGTYGKIVDRTWTPA
jgi:hypothetical protein